MRARRAPHLRSLIINGSLPLSGLLVVLRDSPLQSLRQLHITRLNEYTSRRIVSDAPANQHGPGLTKVLNVVGCHGDLAAVRDVGFGNIDIVDLAKLKNRGFTHVRVYNGEVDDIKALHLMLINDDGFLRHLRELRVYIQHRKNEGPLRAQRELVTHLLSTAPKRYKLVIEPDWLVKQALEGPPK